MKTENLKVLIVEDNPSDVEFIKRELNNAEIKALVEVANTREDFEHSISRFKPDVVLSDHTLPEFNSTEALKIYHQYKQNYKAPSAFILVTGSISEEFAVKKIKEGADDYILKDRMQRLPAAINHALNKNASILERNKAIEEQGRLLDYIKLLLNSTSDGVFGIDEMGLCTFINEAALNMLGYKREQCIGVNMHQLVHSIKKDHSEYPEKECPIYKCTIHNESCLVDDEVFWKSDGTCFHVEYRSSPVIDGNNSRGSVVMFVDISKKINEQRKKELAYRLNKKFDEETELKQCLEFLIREICICEEHFAGELWITNIDNFELKLAAHYCQAGELNLENVKLRFKKGEGLLGSVFKMKTHIFTPDVQADERYLRKEFCRKNNLHSAVAVPVLFKDETIAVIMLYSNTVEKENRTHIILQEDLLTQIGQSIHRKKTENELSTIFDYSPDMICISSDDGYFKKVNGAFTLVLGYTEAELLSRPYIDFVYKDDKELTLAETVEIINGKTTFNFQNRYVTSDGNIKWLSWTSAPLNTEGLIMGIAKDVTLKLKLEKQLSEDKIRQQKELTEAVILAEEKERQRIGGDLHDNVCQLLGLSNMFIGMAKKQMKGKSDSLDEANKLVTAAINEIRNLSHELVPVIFNKKNLEHSIEELVFNVSSTSNLDIEFTCRGIDEENLSQTLKLSLYRIIQEQFNNIIKHSHAKKVCLNLEQIGSHINVMLKDNGVGFNTNAKSKGIGLLNIDSRVTVLKGTMNIISAPGKGCTLEISIPFEQDIE